MLEVGIEVIRQHPVRVARLGQGPPMVLLHGYPDTLMIWSNLAPALAATHEVIAFDWPGMGESEAWRGATTPDGMATRLLALLDAWQLPRVTLVGMDVGGQPALVFAALHPDRVQRLVVMNSLVLGDVTTSWEIDLLRRFGFNRVLLDRFPRLVFGRALRTFFPPGVDLPADVREDLWRCFHRREVRQWIIRLCAGYQGSLHRLPSLYRRIDCPTLLLWGGQDKHFPPLQARRLHELMPTSVLHILDGAEHWMAWDRASEVASAILDFCR